jgi:hypothetical protein
VDQVNDADTTAAPAMLHIGRFDLLVSPLTIGDLGWYERMGGAVKGIMVDSDKMLLVWLGLRRHQPWITWRRCRRMFRRRKRADVAFALTLKLNETAFCVADDDDLKDKTGDGESYSAIILRGMASAYGWPADVVLDLTPAQAQMYFAEDDDGRQGTANFATKEDADAYRLLCEERIAREQAEQEASG